MSKIPNTHDDLFKTLSKQSGIPAAFLKVLGWNESHFDPMAVSSTNVLGFWQVTGGVVKAYNKHNGANFQRDDMTDPFKQGLVACWHLNQILDEYRATGVIPSDLWSTFWQEPGGVGLLFLGYTAGWSREQGVAAVVQRMRAAKVEVTVNKVIDAAGIYFPKSKIYVDPAKKLGPDGKPSKDGVGPYMSDPALRTHIGRELDEYIIASAGDERDTRDKRIGLLMGATVGVIILVAVITKE